jgi:hypothetical protein
MDKWTLERYAVRRLNWEHKVEYWNFFLEKWVSPENVNDDCVTTHSAATCAHNDYYGSEIVEMKITIEEK